jgi:hypothetical protein
MASTLEEKLAKDEEYLAYEHPKATELKAKKEISKQTQTDLNKSNAVYDSMINQTDKFYSQQADAVDKWGQTQTQLQQDRTDFTIEQINQQKAQAEKDYIKEQKGAYTDYQKQTDEYGANAEAMASQGMAGTGYSESAKVAMYNQYQNRVAIARESKNKAELEYNNDIKEAQMQNNSVLAEIAFNTLQQKLTFALQGFQSKNSLILEKLKQGFAIDDRMYTRKRDAISDSRWREQWEYQKQQDALANRRYEDELKYKKERDTLSDTRYDAELKYKKERDSVSDEQWRQELLLAQQKAGVTNNVEYFSDDTKTDYTDYQQEVMKTVPDNNGKWTTETAYVTDTHVQTPYYSGEKNADGKTYGYFTNGYQPKGIAGYGKVEKTGRTEIVSTEMQYGTYKGTRMLIEQNIWQTPDGTLWLWDGLTNKYVEYASARPVFPDANNTDLIPKIVI